MIFGIIKFLFETTTPKEEQLDSLQEYLAQLNPKADARNAFRWERAGVVGYTVDLTRSDLQAMIGLSDGSRGVEV